MVKSNRFVLLQCSGGLPIVGLLNMAPIHVVTKSRSHALRMRDFVLSIYLSTETPLTEHATSPVDPFVLVILNRDLPSFCHNLMDTGNLIMKDFEKRLKMTINVAPKAFKSPASRRYRAPLDPFFTETTVKNLLRPFRTELRGFPNVQVTGKVSAGLAAAVHKEIASNEISDWRAAFEKMVQEKEAGSKLFQQGNIELASLAWLDATADIDRIHQSSTWEELVREGGESFLMSVAELYFLMRLNIAHTELARVVSEGYFTILAEDSLLMARKSLEKGFWAKGQWKWEPEDRHKAKLWYREAMCTRLSGSVERAALAERLLEKALELAPNDAAILKEKESVIAWRLRGYGYGY